MTFDFISALKNNNKDSLVNINKVDLHNHTIYSCERVYLNNFGYNLPKEIKVTDIATLISFAHKYISPIKQSVEGLTVLINGMIEKCKSSGVKIVDTELDYKTCIFAFDSDVNRFVNYLKQFNTTNLTINWFIDISRDGYKTEHKEIILNLLKTKFFKGLDLTSTENIVPNKIFKDFYILANKLNLITKIHAGEQLGPDYVKDCILDFNPKQIQHGISIVKDKSVMQLAKDRNIIFNVCPTSNVVLGYADSIKNHPIKQMVEFGLNVTIGTDDFLLFESDINDEYLKLFNENTLSAEQLEQIRIFGLSIY